MNYAELHAISNYSFLRGASHPHELVERAAQLGYHAIAITDECSLAGVVKAHEAALQHQITLLVGAEFHLAEGLLVVLAQNRQGYASLSQLITLGRRRAEKGSYQLVLADFAALQHCVCLWRQPLYAELLTDDSGSDIAMAQQQLATLAEQVSTTLTHLPCYLLAERQLNAGEAWQLEMLQRLSERWQLPCVAAGNVHMHHATEQRMLDVLTCIRHGKTVDEAAGLLQQNAETAMKPIDAIAKRFPVEWLENSIHIADSCQFSLTELRYEYPAELVPNGLTATQYLAQEVDKGAIKRFDGNVPESVKTQYLRELEIIASLGYEYFFLTIYDLVTFAKRSHILHQGRGSAANSVVCYCLGITEVDPTKVNMLFERFISKERHEPPDIDVDFEHERREEVIQYIYQKYGRHRAALAASVITYRFRSAMRDVGKSLGLDEQRVEQLLASVDRRDSEVWTQQLQTQHLIASAGHAQWLLPLVERLMGFPRHLSQHVGGFIISAGPLAELVPIENAAMAERTVIQWDKDDLESLGLLKVDVLALGMLTAIRKSFSLISRHYQAQPFTMSQVLWEEPQVYRMLQQADSMGVFQVESRAQMSMLPRLRPHCYYDLVVQIAIVRPGPIQGDMVHPYLRRRDGLEQVDYPSAAVRQVLERTLGVPIFQEQVIQLAMVAAGFSGGEADQLRRAMASWKRTGELSKFEQKLTQGMAANGYSEQFAQQIFQQIRGFGEYGFPESHSASFALLAYVSAYLKYYYPAAFCCALLNSQPMGFYSPSQLLQDLKRHHGTVLPVCINRSDWDCTLEPLDDGDYALRLGLRLVKGLSQHSAERLLAGRQQDFSTMAEVTQFAIPRDELEALASANAFASLSGDRHQARWQLAASQQLTLPLLAQAEQQEQQVVLPKVDEVSAMLADYQQLGLTLGKHPLTILRASGQLSGCYTAEQLWQCRHGQVVRVAGLVVGRQRPGTASGVTFITLEDETGHTNLVVWAATASAQRRPFLSARILQVTGVVEFADGVLHVIAGQLTDISHLMSQLAVSSRDFH